MRTGAIPFQFDLSALLAKAKRNVRGRLGDVSVSLNLPFLSVTVSPQNLERQIARELVIRIQDRRVLSAWECCDDCIEKALASLQEIRQLLVDKQVELSEMRDGPLYLLTNMMREGIRQFLTYEEVLTGTSKRDGATIRTPEARQSYFDALELLRGHLSRCLGQVALIAGMDLPQEGVIANYRGPWLMSAYLPLKGPKED